MFCGKSFDNFLIFAHCMFSLLYRKTLDGNFKATRNLRDGLEFKKVHSQLCKFDRFQQSVNKILDAKQASTDETRRLCLARTAHLYQQVSTN